MKSETRATPIDVWLARNRAVAVKCEGIDWEETKTGLAPDKTNNIFNERSGDLEIYVVHDYEIIASEDLQITVTANNDTILSTDEIIHEFGEGVLIEPTKRIEIDESHADKTIPIKIKVRATRYLVEYTGGGA